MSFINNAGSGSQINLLCLIYRILDKKPNQFTEDELCNYCAPNTLFSKENQRKWFKSELSFWSSPPHQLWGKDGNGKLFLDTVGTRNGSTPADVAHQLRLRLMQVSFNDILGDEDEFGSSKAMRSFAYILTQDRFVIFKDELNVSSIDNSFAENFAGYSLNNSEKSYFIEFCNFLGLTEKVSGKEHLDPTRLIKSFIPQVFSDKKELKISDFIARLSEYVPIIDSGEYNRIIRKEISEEMDVSTTLSVNLSHALKRLHEAHVLNLKTLSDDISAIRLTYPNGAVEQVSSIAYIGGE